MPRQDATLWSPDTCDCKFYIRVENERVIFLDHEAVQAEHGDRIAKGDPTANKKLAPNAKLCSAHAAHGHRLHADLVKVVQEERTRRNTVVTLVKDVDPEVKPEEIQWFYDSQRQLHVFGPQRINKPKRDSWQLACDTALGSDKVKIEQTAVITEG